MPIERAGVSFGVESGARPNCGVGPGRDAPRGCLQRGEKSSARARSSPRTPRGARRSRRRSRRRPRPACGPAGAARLPLPQPARVPGDLLDRVLQGEQPTGRSRVPTIASRCPAARRGARARSTGVCGRQLDQRPQVIEHLDPRPGPQHVELVHVADQLVARSHHRQAGEGRARDRAEELRLAAPSVERAHAFPGHHRALDADRAELEHVLRDLLGLRRELAGRARSRRRRRTVSRPLRTATASGLSRRTRVASCTTSPSSFASGQNTMRDTYRNGAISGRYACGRRRSSSLGNASANRNTIGVSPSASARSAPPIRGDAGGRRASRSGTSGARRRACCR